MTTETPAAAPETALVERREAPQLTPFEVIEQVITSGDLGAMKPEARIAFYWRTCESLGLNPLTRPFDFIRDDKGAIIMYARKDATDQLRRIHAVSVEELVRDISDEYAQVEARGSIIDAKAPGGVRRDSALGVVGVKGLSGQARGNAIMKAETKAKRRLTLALVGLGFLDETEVEGLERASIDLDTGELAAQPASLLDSVREQQAKMAGGPAQGVTHDLAATAHGVGSAKVSDLGAAPADGDPEGEPAEAPAADPEGEVEGSWIDAPPETDPEAPPAPAITGADLARRISGAVPDAPAEKANDAQLGELARIFAGIDREVVRAGFRHLFGRVTPFGGQADAVRLVYVDLGAERFRVAWMAMVDEAAKSALAGRSDPA